MQANLNVNPEVFALWFQRGKPVTVCFYRELCFGYHIQEPITAEIESSVDSIFKFAREHMTPMEEEEEKKVKSAGEEIEETESEL